MTISSEQSEFGNTDNDVLFKNDGKCGEGTTKGTCKMVPECPLAAAAIRNKKFHNLERCGFEGITEIVCCPEEETDSRTHIVNRKSEDACKEYVKGLPPDITFLILKGDNATLGEFPHMVALGYLYDDDEEYKWECGASLISNKFVLTAAHCLVRTDNKSPTKVRMGVIDTTGRDNVEALDINIKKKYVNPQYQHRQKRHDIALLELETPVTKNKYVHPACLYQEPNDPIGLVVTGWGLTSQSGDPSSILQKATLEPVPVSTCTKYYEARSSRPILNFQMCAMSNEGKDTCSGDSGGPLQVQQEPSSIYTIVGITSYGIGCGGKNPGVYTRVSAYLDWIESIVWS